MRVLILQGGGCKGAFQAGALVGELERSGVRDYDLIAGVSVGALAAGCLASCERGDNAFARRIERYADMWLKEITGNGSVFKRRLLGWLTGYRGMSLNKTWPLKRLLMSSMDPKMIRESGRHFRIGVWNATTDIYQEADENQAQLREWVRASAAFPLILEPVKLDGDWYADGGVRNNVPHLFLKEFDDIEEIDIFMTSPSECCLDKRTNLRNAKEMVIRLIEAMTSEVLYNDLVPYVRYQMKHERCKIRVFAPADTLDYEPLVFEPGAIREMYELGKKTEPVLFFDFMK